MNDECEEILIPYEMKIKWVNNEENRDAFISKNRVVVKLYHHKNQAKNFLNTTIDFLSTGLLPNSQAYVDELVMKATKYTLAERFFITESRHKALKILKEELIEKEQGTKLYKYYGILRKLDEKGFFTRIFLRDIAELGELAPTGIHPNIQNETIDYTLFFEDIVNRKRREEVEQNFKGQYIQTAIVFIAKPEVFFKHGVTHYTNYVNKRIAEGYRTIYSFARGNNITIAKAVTESLDTQQNLLKIIEKTYPSIITSRGVTGKEYYSLFEKVE